MKKLIALFLVFLLGCNDASKTDKEEEKQIPPVKVISLKSENPHFPLHLTGAVESWKQEEISFEIGGKIDYVIDSGHDVDGALKNIEGKIVSQGTILAKLEPYMYELRVESAKSDIDALKAQYDVIRTEIEYVIPAQLEEAKSNLKLAERNYERLTALKITDTASQSDLDQAKSSFDSAKAKLKQIEAQKKVKEASLRNVAAQMGKLQQVLKTAQLDLEKCVVRAPYDGRVSNIHVIRGGYVQPGKPVLTLLLMDPIKITAAISAKTDRELNIGDFASVFHANWPEPVTGWIYAKDTIADRNTRTFNVQILVRNFKIDQRMEEKPERKKLPQIRDLMPIVSRHYYQPEKMYVNVDCLHKDKKGHFVWRTNHYINEKFDGVVKIKKMYVKMGDSVLDFLGLYTFRSIIIENNQELQEAIDKKTFLAVGVPDGVKNNDQVVLVRENWLFRPGELAKIDLDIASSSTGFYVPMNCIIQEDGEHYVFVVINEEDQDIAKKIRVNLFEHAGTRRRIEAEGIAKGTKVVLHGAHYLIPNERVRIIEEINNESN